MKWNIKSLSNIYIENWNETMCRDMPYLIGLHINIDVINYVDIVIVSG